MIVVGETRLMEKFAVEVKRVSDCLSGLFSDKGLVQLEFNTAADGKPACVAVFYKNSKQDLSEVPAEISGIKIKGAYARMIAIA